MSNEPFKDNLTKSMTGFLKSPMNVFKTSEELKEGVYIVNHGKVVGVVVSQEEYEGLHERVEELEGQLIYAETAKRLEEFEKNPVTFTDEEVRGQRSTINLYDPSDDEWT